MLRIHFTTADLGRVVLNLSPLPLSVEAVVSLQTLRRRDEDLRFGAWRRSLRGRLSTGVQLLWDLVPATGLIPDFLIPVNSVDPEVTTLEAIRKTEGKQITADLNRLPAGHRLATWTRGLAQGDTGALEAVARELVKYRDVAIAPFAFRMQQALDTHLARMTAILAADGAEALLAQVHPLAHWNDSVLRLPAAVDRDVHLDGRGLRLAPLLFCGPLPRIGLRGSDAEPVLGYQIPRDVATADLLIDVPSKRRPETDRALGRLLGTTRAQILRTIAVTPCTASLFKFGRDLR